MELTIPLGFGRKVGIFNVFELSRWYAEKCENPGTQEPRNPRTQPKLHWCFCCLLDTGGFTLIMVEQLQRQIQNHSEKAEL